MGDIQQRSRGVKKILDKSFEKLRFEAQEKVPRRHVLFLKKFDRVISMEEEGDGCHKMM